VQGAIPRLQGKFPACAVLLRPLCRPFAPITLPLPPLSGWLHASLFPIFLCACITGVPSAPAPLPAPSQGFAVFSRASAPCCFPCACIAGAPQVHPGAPQVHCRCAPAPLPAPSLHAGRVSATPAPPRMHPSTLGQWDAPWGNRRPVGEWDSCVGNRLSVGGWGPVAG